MPTVSVDNPDVQVTLGNNETFVVAANTSVVVDVFPNGTPVEIEDPNGTLTHPLGGDDLRRVPLHAGDKIKTGNEKAHIRGWEV
jgi:hypothetical protein